ncbi:MAG: pyridoxamine 5'-phosphate oxidase family protein [Pyrinomonadaceae bacterium]
MVNIEDMPPEEMRALLQGGSFGHLGCARDGRPYVVPMNYSYEGGALYFFTTEGMKTEFLEANQQVCFQVEQVSDGSHWKSVIVNGRAERLTKAEDIQQAMQIILKRNPALTPALNATRIDALGRASNVALYRIQPELMDGRKTV